MYLLVISGVRDERLQGGQGKEIRDQKNLKRLADKKMGDKRSTMAFGHLFKTTGRETWAGHSHSAQPQTFTRIPTQHDKCAQLQRKNGRGPWLPEGFGWTRRCHVCRHTRLGGCHWWLFKPESILHNHRYSTSPPKGRLCLQSAVGMAHPGLGRKNTTRDSPTWKDPWVCQVGLVLCWQHI